MNYDLRKEPVIIQYRRTFSEFEFKSLEIYRGYEMEISKTLTQDKNL